PVLGYGMMYQPLAKQLSGYRNCAFDFIEEDNRIERYTELINQLQPDGPVKLFGYSAGCTLAFETAKQLEAEGRKVERLSTVNSYKT
ncbi:thioesterase domain-containing protein, partial [Bacillus cereus]|uniref:thioesterase domain-containing protein n=1 Tax=Bacillus cereus TaxID=1396 RepID=UPI00201C049E